MESQHQNLAAGKWHSMTIAEQLGNIGSEVGRAMNWKEKSNSDQSQKAFDRALELFDLSLADKRWQYPALKEIARGREVVCDFLVGDNEYGSDKEFLNKYFLQFGMLARNSSL